MFEMMEKVKDKQEMKKTQVFNVIILDRSGSMESIRQAAVEGFNETLAGIKKAQEVDLLFRVALSRCHHTA